MNTTHDNPLGLRVGAALSVLLGLIPMHAFATEKTPIRVGLSAEFGLSTSTSAQSIELGIRTALGEINAVGGLDGRPLELVVRNIRSIPARGVADLEELAQDESIVAVFGGRFSPVMLDMVPVAETEPARPR